MGRSNESSSRPLFVIKRWPQTDDELWEWVATIWGVKIPRVAVCKDHVAPFKAFADAFFARKDPIVWKACVPLDSAILTATGVYPAYYIRPGDVVLGWNEKEARPDWGKIVATQFSGIRPTLRIHTKYGWIRVTENHRVLVRSNRKFRWKKAIDLHPDQDSLILPMNFCSGKSEQMKNAFAEGADIGVALKNLAQVNRQEIDFLGYRFPFKTASPNDVSVFLDGLLFGALADSDSEGLRWHIKAYDKLGIKFIQYLTLASGGKISGISGPAFPYEFQTEITRNALVGRKWMSAPILFISRDQPEAVLDFTVDGTDSFCCDGFIVHNSRGFGGKSFLLATLGITEAVVLGANVTILGGSGAQSQNVHQYMQKFWKKPLAPRNLLLSDPTKMKTTLKNGAEISALLASPTSVRGPHPARLRLDEVDEMDPQILNAALGQPMDQNGIKAQTVLSSTHHYPDRTMTEVLARARDRGWAVYEWCLGGGHTQVRCLSGWKDITEVTPEDKVLTRDGWNQVQHVTKMGFRPCIHIHLSNKRVLVCTEDHSVLLASGKWLAARYLHKGDVLWGCDEPGNKTQITVTDITRSSILLPVFDLGVHNKHELVAEGVIVHNCYRENMAEGGWLTEEEIERKKVLVPEAMWNTEYELQEPSVEGRSFSTGKVEAAFTPKLGVFDSDFVKIQDPVEGATYVTGVDWAKSQDYTIILTYRVDESPWVLVCAERVQRKPWPVMLEIVKSRLAEYPGTCIHDATGLGAVLGDYLGDLTSTGEVLTGRNRIGLFSDYVAAIESGHMIAPRISWMYDDHKYCRITDLWGDGHPPDSVVAAALAWRAKTKYSSRARTTVVYRSNQGLTVIERFDKNKDGSIVSEKRQKTAISIPPTRTVSGALSYLSKKGVGGRRIKKVRDPRYE